MQLFLLFSALSCFLQLLGLAPFGLLHLLPAARNKQPRLRSCAENLRRWRIQILLCFAQFHFIQRFIRVALNVLFQLRANPLRLLVSCKPFIVRLLYWFDEAIVGQLVSCCAGAVLAAYNMRFLQFF